MSPKDVRYATGAIASSDGVRFDTQARLDSIKQAGDLVYKSFNSGEINAKAFDASMSRLENDAEAVRLEQRNAKAAQKWAGSADSAEHSGASSRPLNLRDKRGAPSVMLSDAQCKGMWEAAQSRTPTSVRVKDSWTSQGFNTAESLLPAELAPWITKWVYEKRILDRLPTVACDSPMYEIVRDSGIRSGSAAVVPEGGVKPEIVITANAIVLPMLKIAANFGVSWETVSDYDRYMSYLQQVLPLEIIQTENYQLLYGLGETYGELLGFANTPGILVNNLMGADDVTALDGIEESVEIMRSQPGVLSEPSLLITSPSSWSALRRIKDLYGRYYLSPDPSQGQGNQIWGIPVLTTTQCIPGDAFLLDTDRFGAAVIREGLVVRQGLSEDDFIRNIIRFISEERLNLAVERPLAVMHLENLPTTSGVTS